MRRVFASLVLVGMPAWGTETPTAEASPAARAPQALKDDDESAPRMLDENGRSYRLVTLTADEAQALDDGELGSVRYTLGGIASLYPGFGLGHAIQGRWGSAGWRYTVGEAASVAAVMGGVLALFGCGGDVEAERRCDTNVPTGALIVGGIGFTLLRVLEIADAWGGGSRHRESYDRATRKIAAAKALASHSNTLIVPALVGGAPGIVAGFTY
jgi:hypothetical protein